MRWRYRETVLALCTAALFVTMAGRLAISPVVPEIAAEFGVSNGVLGAALSGMWVAYALAQFPSGVIADRIGERPVILASIGGTGIAAVVIALSPGLFVFVAGTILLGGLAGLHYSVATSLLTRTYDGIGTAIGIHNGGAPLAGVVTPVVVAWVAVAAGWRVAVGLAGIVAVPVFALFAWRVHPTEPRRPDEPMRARLEPGTIRELLTRRSIVFTGIVAVICDFTWQALASFLPTFLVAYHGYSATFAGTLFAAYFLAQGVLQIGVGILADRVGRDATTAGCMIAGIAGLGALVLAPGLGTILAGLLSLAVGMGWAAAVFPRFMDLLSTDEQGAGFGLIRTAYMVVAASGSVVVGSLADLFGWAVAFGFPTALLGVVCLLLAANWTVGLE